MLCERHKKQKAVILHATWKKIPSNGAILIIASPLLIYSRKRMIYDETEKIYVKLHFDCLDMLVDAQCARDKSFDIQSKLTVPKQSRLFSLPGFLMKNDLRDLFQFTFFSQSHLDMMEWNGRRLAVNK